MKQLCIISGKGGTGKTTVAASFSVLAKNKVICDCDVDASNLFLLLNPVIKNEEEISVSKIALIDKAKCIQCGKCIEYCRFDAISDDYIVDEIKCEGCGVCRIVCPADAIMLQDTTSGKIFTSDTEYGRFYYAQLNPGSGNSGKLVSEIRKKAFKFGSENNNELIIIDGSPGIGCPVISSIAGTDLVLIVTEPTLSGIHDLQRVYKLVRHFKIKPFVLINKYDINIQNTKVIEDYCKSEGIKFIFKIPYNPIVSKSIIAGKPLVKFTSNEITEEINRMWNIIYEELFG